MFYPVYGVRLGGYGSDILILYLSRLDVARLTKGC